MESQHDDVYLWKTGQHVPSNKFSTAKTWLELHPPPTPVPWSKSVWFKDRIPKHAFISWVVAWNRLHTRDRLSRWGLTVPTNCILCNLQEESRDHLFFECEFSSEMWTFFTLRTNLTLPPRFMDCLLWLQTTLRDKHVSLIIKLRFQASIYFIWRERNAQIHSSISKTAAVLIKEIQLILRARLDPLSRAPRSQSSLGSILAAWFSMFQFR